MEQLFTYSLGTPRATAFTTTRTIGRDAGLLCPLLGVATGRFARPHQVHKTEVRQLAEEFFRLPESTRKMLLDGVDAVIYDVREAVIGISTADCIPVVAYDAEHHVAAAIHAGWRGTVACIVPEAIRRMAEAYGTRPERLRCVIGPGISLASFEVGDEVYEAFRKAGFDMSAISRRMSADSREADASRSTAGITQSQMRVLESTPPKWHIDLKRCNALQLMSLGVPETAIDISPIDTMTDGRCFSARREGARTGRMLTGIVLH